MKVSSLYKVKSDDIHCNNAASQIGQILVHVDPLYIYKECCLKKRECLFSHSNPTLSQH
jgi:hypothetical protein